MSDRQTERRTFLGFGAAALLIPTLGSVGCDKSAEGAKGVAAEPSGDDEAAAKAKKAEADAHDVKLFNDGILLEQAAINVYKAAAGLPFIKADAKVIAVAGLFMGQHEEHRDTLAAIIEQLGGKPVDPATAKTPEIPKAILDESLEAEARKIATLEFARKLEKQAADAYHKLIVEQLLTDLGRRSAAEILPVEAQHVAVYDLVLGKEKPVNAALFKEQT